MTGTILPKFITAFSVAMISAAPLLASAGGLETFDPHALALRRVALISLVYDEESGSQSPLPSLIERELGKSGYTVGSDREDAELVIIPTTGRIRPSGSGYPMTGGIANVTSRSTLTSLSSGSDMKTPSPGVNSATRVGLLLTAYKAAEWRELEETGKIPRPVWRIYEWQEFGNSGFQKTCLELVRKCVRYLKNGD
jgi:hypothetical protein